MPPSRASLKICLITIASLACMYFSLLPRAHAQLSEGPELDALKMRIYQAEMAGKTTEAISLYKRALAVAEKTYGQYHQLTASYAANTGAALALAGRTDEARPYYQKDIAARERLIATNKSATVDDYIALSSTYSLMEEYAKAEAVAKKNLAIQEQRFGPSHPNVAKALDHFASVYNVQNRFPEQTPLLRRAVTIWEKAANGAKARIGTVAGIDQLNDNLSRINAIATMNQLIGTYTLLDRYEEAETVAQKSLGVAKSGDEIAAGFTALLYSQLGEVYAAQDKFKDAEKFYRRAVTEEQKTPPEPSAGAAGKLLLAGYMSDLADVLFKLGRYDEAERWARDAVPIARLGGPGTADDISTTIALGTLARVEQARRRYASADQFYLRRQKIFALFRGPENNEFARALGERALLKQAEGDLQQAYELIRQATSVLTRNIRLRIQGLTMGASGQSRPKRFYHGPTFAVHLSIAADLARRKPEQSPVLGAETFELSQWVQHSQASAALSQMTARFANGEGELAELVRRRQDLVGKYQVLDRKILTAMAKPSQQRISSQENQWRKSADEAESSIAEIDRILKEKFAEYAALANPAPLSVKEVQAQLKSDEALLQIAVDDAETYVWAVTANEMRWTAIPIGSAALADDVAALRCGLDESSWAAATAGKASALSNRCQALVASAGAGLPFDLARAHALYLKLLAPFEAQIKGKHLLYVPSGPLTTLPPHVLVTSAPETTAGPHVYEKAAWLGLAQPITVLPSTSNLRSLRSYASTSSAPNPFAGFGNPLLSGQDGRDRSAWAKQTCGDTGTLQLVAERKPLRSTLRALYRDRYADVSAIRRQTPLPETADEVCFVAKALGAPPDAIFLGGNATEAKIKSLSYTGKLKSWRILHFATHGLVAGETESLSVNQAEPALLLTPPDAASEDDDGLLTASEVAKLKLDADWVILSACNTASADGTPGAEALSGLASAFFYAGTRSLLVSHWYVNSEAAVKLITDMFAELRRKPDMPRAEALRLSIGARILEGGARAHPSYWAPFVVVGAG